MLQRSGEDCHPVPRLQLSQLQMSGEQFQVAPNKRFTRALLRTHGLRNRSRAPGKVS